MNSATDRQKLKTDFSLGNAWLWAVELHLRLHFAAALYGGIHPLPCPELCMYAWRTGVLQLTLITHKLSFPLLLARCIYITHLSPASCFAPILFSHHTRRVCDRPFVPCIYLFQSFLLHTAPAAIIHKSVYHNGLPFTALTTCYISSRDWPFPLTTTTTSFLSTELYSTFST
jgi:hypothetical protein